MFYPVRFGMIMQDKDTKNKIRIQDTDRYLKHVCTLHPIPSPTSAYAQSTPSKAESYSKDWTSIV